MSIWGSRGILNPTLATEKFRLMRYLPALDLCFWVERYWVVEWDLTEPYLQENLPYPCVNLAIEQSQSGVFGITTGKFARRLQGRGRVFGIKFRPGAFYPFVQRPISQLTDKTTPLSDVFGAAGDCLETTILGLASDDEAIKTAEGFLRERLPEPDTTVMLINEIVDCIINNRDITKVDDIVNLMGINKRSLQRMFSQYVGVSPKWVIKRYRLQEAAERLAQIQAVNWSKLALELGYFDQAHFIKDFKRLIGQTPAEYAQRVGQMKSSYPFDSGV